MVYQGSSIHWLYARLIAPNDQELRLPGKIDSLSTAWGKLYKTSLIKEHDLRFVPVRQIGTEDLLFNVYYFTWVKKPSICLTCSTIIEKQHHLANQTV